MPAKKTATKSTEVTSKAPAAKKAAKKTAKKAAKKTAGETPAAEARTLAKIARVPVATKATPDMIARAAYLNYRRRVEQGLPGDRENDWIEAERQFSE